MLRGEGDEQSSSQTAACRTTLPPSSCSSSSFPLRHKSLPSLWVLVGGQFSPMAGEASSRYVQQLRQPHCARNIMFNPLFLASLPYTRARIWHERTLMSTILSIFLPKQDEPIGNQESASLYSLEFSPYATLEGVCLCLVQTLPDA